MLAKGLGAVVKGAMEVTIGVVVAAVVTTGAVVVVVTTGGDASAGPVLLRHTIFSSAIEQVCI